MAMTRTLVLARGQRFGGNPAELVGVAYGKPEHPADLVAENARLVGENVVIREEISALNGKVEMMARTIAELEMKLGHRKKTAPAFSARSPHCGAPCGPKAFRRRRPPARSIQKWVQLS